MSLVLAWLFAFAAGFTLVAGLGFALRKMVLRHPDLLLSYREAAGEASWAVRVWRLGVQLASRELPGTRLETLRARIARDLGRTGAPARITPEVFLGQTLLEGLGITIVILVISLAAFGRPLLLLALLAGAGHAFLLRPHLLQTRATERVAEISKRLPYSIDLAVLLLGAGGTLREALDMLATGSTEDPLADELALAIANIRTGTPQAKALTDMAKRVQLEELTTLVLGINRGEETGSPMTTTLQTQSEVFRLRRLQKIERLAVEAPVKMMVPNMIIMLAVLLIVVGPFLVSLASGPGVF